MSNRKPESQDSDYEYLSNHELIMAAIKDLSPFLEQLAQDGFTSTIEYDGDSSTTIILQAFGQNGRVYELQTQVDIRFHNRRVSKPLSIYVHPMSIRTDDVIIPRKYNISDVRSEDDIALARIASAYKKATKHGLRQIQEQRKADQPEALHPVAKTLITVFRALFGNDPASSEAIRQLEQDVAEDRNS